jgi:hypothetical protein
VIYFLSTMPSRYELSLQRLVAALVLRPSYNQQKSGATIIRLADRYRTAVVRVSPCDEGPLRSPVYLSYPTTDNARTPGWLPPSGAYLLFS